ncbi:DUF1302 family protein [Pseudomonas aeruginosa]
MVFPWSHVQAQSFDLENGVTIDWDTTLAYGAAWRVQGQNSRLLNGFTTADSGFVPSMVNTAVGPLPVRGALISRLVAITRMMETVTSIKG